MGLILTLIIGGLVGWLASIIMNTNQQMGAVSNVIVGIVGAVLGAFIYGLLFNGEASLTTAFLNFSFGGLLISVLGAMLLIGVLKAFRRDHLL